MNPNSKGMKRVLCCSLPEELVEEILVRLPADSLVRFKGVCKWWRALISDRSFANKQLRICTDNEKISPSASLLFKLARPLVRDSHFPFYSNNCEDVVFLGSIRREDDRNNDDLHCVLDRTDLVQFLVTKKALTTTLFPRVTVTHCNGIICMVNCGLEEKRDILMCNPALKEFKCISQPVREHECDIIGEGFGYDSRSDDYKFVRVHSFRRNSASVSRTSYNYKVCLYTLGTDSWTEIKLDIGVGMFILCKKGVYCRNVYYWRSLLLEDFKEIVLAFDMSKEEFRRIRLPFQKDDLNWTRYTLASWKESVVLFNKIELSRPFSLIEMWVMANKGDGDAFWTKHLIIGPLEHVLNPLKFWKDDELLIETTDRVILSYNLYTKKIRIVPIGFTKSISDYRVEPFVKSLVSIKRGNCSTAKATPQQQSL